MKKYAPLFLLTTAAFGAQKCDPIPPVACHEENCQTCHCLGPAQTIANAPAYPRTCNGDFVIEVAGLYWKAEQDGMEYAIDNAVSITNDSSTPQVQNLVNLIDAEYMSPKFHWDFGFLLGLAYQTTCDGWDVGLTWLNYQGNASSHDEAEDDDNHNLIPLWTAFKDDIGFTQYANDIETHWDVKLNLVDIELGRKFWVSHYLALRPSTGIRIGWIGQNFSIQHRGGSWSISTFMGPRRNNNIDMKNNFKGAGIISGLEADWGLGCGFALYTNFAASLLYGRFDIKQDEENRSPTVDFAKQKVLEIQDHFHSSRAIIDLALGLQWCTLFCDCSYGFTIKLGWEEHLFFHQNQLWRIERKAAANQAPPNNQGENVHNQRRGTLSTQGWTLTALFEF